MDKRLIHAFRRSKAFSLIELIVVMTIIVIVLAFAIPSITSVLVGSTLQRAGYMAADTLALARQEAVSHNCEVQVAFFELPTELGGTAWRGIQIWRVDQSPAGSANIRISKLITLPSPIIIADTKTLSPLLTETSIVGTTNVAGYTNVNYRSFRFRANGAPDSSIGTSNFITIHSSLVEANPPVNYVAIQINPITGKLTIIRP